MLTLSNGVEVWLKPTDFRNDQVIFTSYARGGMSLAPPADYLNASLSHVARRARRLGGFTPVDLGKLLAGQDRQRRRPTCRPTRTASPATPRRRTSRRRCSCSTCSSPRRTRDPAAFELMKQRLEAALANQAQNPGLGVRRARARRQHDGPLHRASRSSSRTCRSSTRSGCRRIYERASPTPPTSRSSSSARSRWTRSRRCSTTYIALAAVDAARRRRSSATTAHAVPDDGRARDGEQGAGAAQPDGHDVLRRHRPRRDRDASRCSAAAQVLEKRLRDILREELGGTYSVGVGYSDTSPQPGYGTRACSSAARRRTSRS